MSNTKDNWAQEVCAQFLLVELIVTMNADGVAIFRVRIFKGEWCQMQVALKVFRTDAEVALSAHVRLIDLFQMCFAYSYCCNSLFPVKLE